MSHIDKLLKLRSWQVWLLFVVLSGVFYFMLLSNFFVSDDFHWLTLSKDIGLSWRIFVTNYEGNSYGGSYNPILFLIFKFFYSLFGKNYTAYHVVSILGHATNAWLVYLLARRILPLAKLSNTKILSLVAGLVFCLWPVHVETVGWISAWPHIWVSIFYLLALVKYFDFKRFGKNKYLYWSFIFFVASLWTKEIAISFPFVILMAEIYFNSVKKETKGAKTYIYLPSYFLVLVLFLIARYLSIGLLFGYYGSHDLTLSITTYIGNLVAYLGDIITFGFIRSLMYKALYYYGEPIMIILFVSLALYFFVLLMKKKWLQFTLFAGFLFVLAPMTITGLHHLTFAGERYMYLPASLFVIWLLVLIYKINWLSKLRMTMLALFLLLAFSVISYKAIIWQNAGSLSRQIVDSFADLDVGKDQTFVSVALPDNLSGAEVFRNNLGLALKMYYPDKNPEVLPTYAYLMVNKQNKNDQLLKWRRDHLGWFAESTDGSFVVTGITSIEVNDVYWELWNYNYQNYTANTIRFIPNKDLMPKIESGDVKILIFDQGKLKILD